MKKITLLLCSILLVSCGTPGDIDSFNRRWAAMDKPAKECEIRPISQTHVDVICK